jgi:protein gp37
MASARIRLWALIEETPHLDWLLLTKRPENISRMVSWDAGDPWPKNAWVGTTAESQEEADKRIPALLNHGRHAPVRFVSCEPLLGPLDLTSVRIGWEYGNGQQKPICINTFEEHVFNADEGEVRLRPLNWVISGGESGHSARPMHPDWPRSLRDQCAAAGVPYHFKQWGEWKPSSARPVSDPDEACLVRLGKKLAGRELDGVIHNAFPHP